MGRQVVPISMVTATGRCIVTDWKQVKQHYYSKLNRLFTGNWTERTTKWRPRPGKRTRSHTLTKWSDDIVKFEGVTGKKNVQDTDVFAVVRRELYPAVDEQSIWE